MGALDAQQLATVHWQNGSWVGEYHTAILVEAMRERDALLRAPRAVQCTRVAQLLADYVRQIQRNQRLYRGQAPAAVAGRFVEEAPECRGVSKSPHTAGMSAQGLVRLAAFLVGSDDEGDPVTGAFAPYLDQIEAAVSYGFSPASIGHGINAVLADAIAAQIAPADLDLVFAAASLALESVDYWYDFESSGGWSGGDSGDPILPTSVTLASAGKSWKGAAASDYVGCTAASMISWVAAAGPLGWKVLAATCVLGGASASIIYAF